MVNKPRITYTMQFAILLGLTGVGMMLASVISIFVWKMMTNASFFAIQQEILLPQNANAAKVIQLLSTVFTFFLPAFFYVRFISKRPLRYLGFRTKMNIRQLAIVVLVVLVGFALSGALSELNELIPVSKSLAIKFQKMESDYMDQVIAMTKMKNLQDYLVSLVIIAVLPAIVEETFFRGALQQLFIKWMGNAWFAIILTSIIFSAIHFSFYGFLPRAALGVILGLLFYYSKNIWISISAHFLNNAMGVTQLFMLSKNGKAIPKDSLNDHFPIWYGLVAATVLVILFVAFRKESVRIGVNSMDNTFYKTDNPFEDE